MESKAPEPLEPAGTFYYLRLAVEIVKLNRQAMGKVVGDEKALIFGLAITAVGAALTVVSHADVLGLFVFALVAIVTLFLFAGFVHLLAGYSKGKEEFLGLVRITALSGILDWLAVIPLTAVLVTIWGLVVAIVATRQVYGVSKGRAVLFVFLSVSALWAISFVLFSGPLGTLYDPRGP
jgi:hypothetical protein